MSNERFYLVNKLIGRSAGPFTTIVDAVCAKDIGDKSTGWNDAQVMTNKEHNEWRDSR